MSDWTTSEDGRTRTRTEYWLMYETPRGSVKRWFAFTERKTAEDTIPDADRTTRAKRWGIKIVEVTQYVRVNTQWR